MQCREQQFISTNKFSWIEIIKSTLQPSSQVLLWNCLPFSWENTIRAKREAREHYSIYYAANAFVILKCAFGYPHILAIEKLYFFSWACTFSNKWRRTSYRRTVSSRGFVYNCIVFCIDSQLGTSKQWISSIVRIYSK